MRAVLVTVAAVAGLLATAGARSLPQLTTPDAPPANISMTTTVLPDGRSSLIFLSADGRFLGSATDGGPGSGADALVVVDTTEDAAPQQPSSSSLQARDAQVIPLPSGIARVRKLLQLIKKYGAKFKV